MACRLLTHWHTLHGRHLRRRPRQHFLARASPPSRPLAHVGACRYRCTAARRCVFTSGDCGNCFSAPVNGPSHTASGGVGHNLRNTTPSLHKASIAARAVRAIHHVPAPAFRKSARTCLWALLGRPDRDFSSIKSLARETRPSHQECRREYPFPAETRRTACCAACIPTTFTTSSQDQDARDSNAASYSCSANSSAAVLERLLRLFRRFSGNPQIAFEITPAPFEDRNRRHHRPAGPCRAECRSQPTPAASQPAAPSDGTTAPPPPRSSCHCQ
jgi:hypothetical protein